jgi:hypothetical protein
LVQRHDEKPQVSREGGREYKALAGQRPGEGAYDPYRKQRPYVIPFPASASPPTTPHLRGCDSMRQVRKLLTTRLIVGWSKVPRADEPGFELGAPR